MVLINPSATGIVSAGSGYTLTCIALKTVSGLTQSILTRWTGPDGAPVVTSGSAAVSESLRTIQNITFDSLSTSDAGEYGCVSTYTSPAVKTPYQMTRFHEVTVSGGIKKTKIVYVPFTIALYLFLVCSFIT